MSKYARKDIQKIEGYVPGEQPQQRQYIKLNTNENPYPPATSVGATLLCFNWDDLRLYSEPSAKMVREKAASIYGVDPDWILCGNGSDDLLTIGTRPFANAGDAVAYTDPSYSLYPVLADLQEAIRRPIPLDAKYWLPENAAQLAGDAKIFFLARPNAPTGNSFPIRLVEKLATEFKGVVWIDEAYADFAEDNCLELIKKFDNVIVSRTFSKSYSLAGLRLGMAFANPDLLKDMFKLKDSYNVSMLTQYIGVAALTQNSVMKANAKNICKTRDKFCREMEEIGVHCLPSQTNFVFARIPDGFSARQVFNELKDKGILVRYFNQDAIKDFIRISIGTPENMTLVTEAMTAILHGNNTQKNENSRQ